ncbi:MAG TPA: transcriptional regulator [Kosmotogaceae bacterium]|nr:transcriptional regulator [Kosmotogaceae bacterium]
MDVRETILFKALSDPIRLRLASLLAIAGEKCVCVLAQALDEPDFKISRHLGIMRSAGMVESRREGTWIYYKLAKPHNEIEESLQKCLKIHMKHHETIKQDLERLEVASCSIEPGLKKTNNPAIDQV